MEDNSKDIHDDTINYFKQQFEIMNKRIESLEYRLKKAEGDNVVISDKNIDLATKLDVLEE